MNDFDRGLEALTAARKVVFFTGAGISVASGIPTFRDKLTGLWERHRPESLETAKAFRENPQLVWGWYLWRRSQAGKAEPNEAHLSICKLANSGRHVSVVTQNIDDLHERAGSQNVVHLHGSLSKPICFACRRATELMADQLTISMEGELVEPPRCGRCNGRLRPGVVWFGEDLPNGAWKAAMTEVRDCDVLISVGTSGIVRPAADIPEIALASGATVIHINIRDVCLGAPNELMLIGSASQVLPALLHATPPI